VTLTSGDTEISKVTFTALATKEFGWLTSIEVGIILLALVAATAVAVLTVRRPALRFRNGHRHIH
jgi:hypothetical protein